MEASPFIKAEDLYNCVLDKRKESDSFGQGMKRLLKLLISWLPVPEEEEKFHLAHPEHGLKYHCFR